MDSPSAASEPETTCVADPRGPAIAAAVYAADPVDSSVGQPTRPLRSRIPSPRNCYRESRPLGHVSRGEPTTGATIAMRSFMVKAMAASNSSADSYQPATTRSRRPPHRPRPPPPFSPIAEHELRYASPAGISASTALTYQRYLIY